MNNQHYQILAEVFTYPQEGYKEHIASTMELMNSKYPEAAEAFQRFSDFVQENDLYRIEEIFAKTFHIQAICFLDLGYVMFGEDYKRGDFLVHMKREQEKVNNDCGEELADNIANVFRLMSMTKDEDFLNDLATEIVIPAMDKMLVEFDGSRMALREKQLKKKMKVIIQEGEANLNVYQSALYAVSKVVKADYTGQFAKKEEKVHNPRDLFTTTCGTCE